MTWMNISIRKNKTIEIWLSILRIIYSFLARLLASSDLISRFVLHDYSCLLLGWRASYSFISRSKVVYIANFLYYTAQGVCYCYFKMQYKIYILIRISIHLMMTWEISFQRLCMSWTIFIFTTTKNHSKDLKCTIWSKCLYCPLWVNSYQTK